jgi:hypothetical protein
LRVSPFWAELSQRVSAIFPESFPASFALWTRYDALHHHQVHGPESSLHLK